MVKVGILVGSLRKDSLSKKIAKNVVDLFPEGYEVQFVEIGDLPLYNQDYDESDTPETYEVFRKTIKGLDALLFVTPEHNRTTSVALKNALDIGSRPPGNNVWSNKPAAIISQSPGRLGGMAAALRLRQLVSVLNMPVVKYPEVYISNSENLLDENGRINNEDLIKNLKSLIRAFVKLINRYIN